MKAKKSLGQNFLKSETILKKIVEAGNVNSKDVVLEIGPGKGALTEKILEAAGQVIAVEKDRELFEFLINKFATELESGKMILIHGDILELDTDEIFENQKYKIVANIPYNITGAILKKFLTARRQPSDMTLLVQKEVADRIMARDGKESLLSISVKAYGKPGIALKVGKEYFKPRPKVDSAVIHIGEISRKFFLENQINEVKFWKIVRAGFAHKRKRLSSNLRDLGLEKLESYEEILGLRAENMTLKNWVFISKN
ncbi:MAG TPA: 16S rRNA (adenine(1518)-N(6)/adenine(1519)-N(6))-dimethyltransferase RsmA [Candidatus Paceibacterota bacterium]|jgi:16S rRNA (adenine1518-N6/adenine1519-N6)-dimethyltransferase|nr:16S rRNA (adenine(1518)-N(6)/adenine(1519)-N(6))-dimethyltransferase RsmA [Candidatus Paceibacterota bacterium]